MLNVFSHPMAASRARLFGLLCAWMAWAPTAQAAEAKPPEAEAPALFTQYQVWRDEPLRNWREANDRVGEIGGWRTYLREAQQGGGGMDNGHHEHHGH